MRSISAQFRKDIKAAKKIWLPWRLLLPLMVLCFPVFVFLAHYGMLNVAVPALNCVGVFGFLIYLKWTLRWQPLFWTLIAVFAAVHALLIWYIPWTTKWVPAAAIAGVNTVDFCIMLWVIVAVEAWFGEQSTSES